MVFCSIQQLKPNIEQFTQNVEQFTDMRLNMLRNFVKIVLTNFKYDIMRLFSLLGVISFFFTIQSSAQDAYSDKFKKANKLYEKSESDYKEFTDKYFYISSPDAPIFFITNKEGGKNINPLSYTTEEEWNQHITSVEIPLDWFKLDNYQMDLRLLSAVPLYYICKANKYDVESGNIFLKAKYVLENGESVIALNKKIESAWPFTSQYAIIRLLLAGDESTNRSEVSLTEKMQNDTEHEITLRLWIEDAEKKEVLMELCEQNYKVKTPKNRFDFTKNAAFSNNSFARYWSNSEGYSKCQKIGERVVLNEVKDATWVKNNLPGFKKYHGSVFFVHNSLPTLAVIYESQKGTLEYHELFFNFKQGEDPSGRIKNFNLKESNSNWENYGCDPFWYWKNIKYLNAPSKITMRSTFNPNVKNARTKRLKKYSYDGKRIPVN